jgi:hypothetical protein
MRVCVCVCQISNLIFFSVMVIERETKAHFSILPIVYIHGFVFRIRDLDLDRGSFFISLYIRERERERERDANIKCSISV